jgi:hypothetical protein
MEFTVSWWTALLIPVGITILLALIQMSDYKSAKITCVLTIAYTWFISIWWAITSETILLVRILLALVFTVICLLILKFVFKYINNKILKNSSSLAEPIYQISILQFDVFDANTKQKIGGAFCLARNEKTKLEYSTYTRNSGLVEINIPCDFYTVTISAQGYNPHTEAIRVGPNSNGVSVGLVSS